jgi:hypothetical protein
LDKPRTGKIERGLVSEVLEQQGRADGGDCGEWRVQRER